MKKYIIVLLLLFGSINAYSQVKTKIDTLYNELGFYPMQVLTTDILKTAKQNKLIYLRTVNDTTYIFKSNKKLFGKKAEEIGIFYSNDSVSRYIIKWKFKDFVEATNFSIDKYTFKDSLNQYEEDFKRNDYYSNPTKLFMYDTLNNWTYEYWTLNTGVVYMLVYKNYITTTNKPIIKEATQEGK